MERCRRRHGDMFTLRVAQEGVWVLLADPEMVKQVFTGDPRIFHAGEGNHILLPLLGSHSVLLLDETPHMTQRKLLLPPFHGERVERYGEVIAEAVRSEIERWPEGRPLSIWPRMQEVTLEIIMRAVFGIQGRARLERIREPLRTLLDWTVDRGRLVAFALLGPRRIQKVPAFQRARGRVDALIYEEIASRRRDPALEEREDMLSLLLQARHEDGRPMSDDELRDELMTLLVAGHETTATALAWAIERLVRHPDKLERLRAEAADGDDAYADAVVKETLRLRPVLPLVARRLTEPVEIGGRLLPAGVTVTPCIYLIHRREDVYPEPRRFRPERFLEQPAGTYTWIPFGGGVRRCLGASFALFEMKRALATLVEALDLRPANPESEAVTRRAITFGPERGAEVVVARRGSLAAAGTAHQPEAAAA
jgi:cytochrome P450